MRSQAAAFRSCKLRIFPQKHILPSIEWDENDLCLLTPPQIQQLLSYPFSGIRESKDCARIDLGFFFRVWNHGRKLRKHSLVPSLHVIYRVHWVSPKKRYGQRIMRESNAMGLIFHSIYLQKHFCVSEKEKYSLQEMISSAGVLPLDLLVCPIYRCSEILLGLFIYWTRMTKEVAVLILQYYF
jgi:hypothetical protein